MQCPLSPQTKICDRVPLMNGWAASQHKKMAHPKRYLHPTSLIAPKNQAQTAFYSKDHEFIAARLCVARKAYSIIRKDGVETCRSEIFAPFALIYFSSVGPAGPTSASATTSVPDSSDNAAGPPIAYLSSAQAPKSINLQRELQNGREGLSKLYSNAFPHCGQRAIVRFISCNTSIRIRCPLRQLWHAARCQAK